MLIFAFIHFNGNQQTTKSNQLFLIITFGTFQSKIRQINIIIPTSEVIRFRFKHQLLCQHGNPIQNSHSFHKLFSVFLNFQTCKIDIILLSDLKKVRTYGIWSAIIIIVAEVQTFINAQFLKLWLTKILLLILQSLEWELLNLAEWLLFDGFFFVLLTS